MKKILKTLLVCSAAIGSVASLMACSSNNGSNGISFVAKTGSNLSDVISAADQLINEKVDAIFTPSDNTIMNAELSIYEDLADAGIPHFAGADSFALNGAFCGYGVDYANLGTETGKMIVDILENKKDPATYPVKTFDNGTATVNKDVAAKLGYNISDVEKAFLPYCTAFKTVSTSEAFEDVGDVTSYENPENADYTIGICNYVDDASLNQIVYNIEQTLKDDDKSFKIVYENCQADTTVMTQIIDKFIHQNKVDLMVGVATPVAMRMQSATEGTDLPVVFAAVSDPVGCKLVSSLDKPGSNVTGTSDYLDTNAVMNLIFALKPEAKKIGLLYDLSQDSSTTAIEAAKKYLESKNK